MPIITYQGERYDCEANESVLDCLTRHDVSYPSSCKNGICQSCLMVAVEGEPTSKSKEGLKDTLKVQNYFLACSHIPDSDMVVADPDSSATQQSLTKVIKKELLNDDILRLQLSPENEFIFRPGQFISVKREDGLVRSYSIASLPDSDEQIELHVRQLDNGDMTTWMHESLDVGDSVTISGPAGECMYLPTDLNQRLILVGTGSGLAPLWGILRDALQQGHKGDIHLFHGSYTAAGLYLVDELRALEKQYKNFHYTPCVDIEAPENVTQGRIDTVLLDTYPDMKGNRLYICGHPDMVQGIKKKCFLAGGNLKEMFSDPFVLSEPEKTTA